MANLKIKQFREDFENNTSQQVGVVTKDMSSMAGVAGTAKYAGPAFTFSAAQLRGLFNRLDVGTNLALCGTGNATRGDDGNYGVEIMPAVAVINGRIGTTGSCSCIQPPVGTQAAATYCKYLISTGFGSSGTITAGNQAASSTAALLPECPENHVAIGFIEYLTAAAKPIVWRTAHGNLSTSIAFSGGVGAATGTGGTAVRNGAVVGVGVSGFTQLNGMPFQQ